MILIKKENKKDVRRAAATQTCASGNHTYLFNQDGDIVTLKCVTCSQEVRVDG